MYDGQNRESDLSSVKPRHGRKQMGFAVAVSVPDGVAIAADSRLQASVREGPPSIMSETQQKIVPLSTFVTALTPDPYLLGPDVAVNARATFERIRPDLPRDAKLDELLDELPGRFLSAAGVNSNQVEGLAVKLIGYSDADRAVKVVGLDGLADPQPLHSTVETGVDWFGFVDIVSRLVKGQTAISVEGLDPAPPIEYLIPTQLMSLSDALSLAETLVQTTTVFGRFVHAVIPPGQAPEPVSIPVGGAVQSAVVRPSGFEWVKRPDWTATREELSPSDPGSSQ